MKKIMKELMAKKNLTPKEKKLLAKMKKGGGIFDWLFGTKTTDPTEVTKNFETVKNDICKVCKAAFGEEGCKCGNTAPVTESVTPSGNSSVTPVETNSMTGEGNLEKEPVSPEEVTGDQMKAQGQPERLAKGGKSSKRKSKRSKRKSKKMQKKMNW